MDDKLLDAAVDLRLENKDLRARLEAAESELTKMKKHYRQPTHGPCCTCQSCGKDYDDCRCDLDEIAEENAQLREVLARYLDCTDASGTTLRERLDALEQP